MSYENRIQKRIGKKRRLVDNFCYFSGIENQQLRAVLMQLVPSRYFRRELRALERYVRRSERNSVSDTVKRGFDGTNQGR